MKTNFTIPAPLHYGRTGNFQFYHVQKPRITTFCWVSRYFGGRELGFVAAASIIGWHYYYARWPFDSGWLNDVIKQANKRTLTNST